MTAVENETQIDDAGQTNIPLTWHGTIENPALLELLFKILTTPMTDPASTQIRVKCARSLQHLAFIRHQTFTDQNIRFAYVKTFMNQIVELGNNQAICETILEDR